MQFFPCFLGVGQILFYTYCPGIELNALRMKSVAAAAGEGWFRQGRKGRDDPVDEPPGMKARSRKDGADGISGRMGRICAHAAARLQMPGTSLRPRRRVAGHDVRICIYNVISLDIAEGQGAILLSWRLSTRRPAVADQALPASFRRSAPRFPPRGSGVRTCRWPAAGPFPDRASGGGPD